jgi:hypothetical protein
MAALSNAGPGTGVNKPEDVIIEEHEEFDCTRLFVSWSGNGYKEDTCWLLADLDNVCKLSSWE